MKILFHLGHPAHFHLFKEIIKELRRKSHQITIVIKRKDVLENLLSEIGWEYHNVYPKERKNNKLSIALSLVKRDIEVFKIAYKIKPEIMIGSSAEIAHVGKILRIPSIILAEDDADQIPFFAKIAYPLATLILAPSSCSTGKWEHKSIKYNGYHELCYLHPNYYKIDNNVVEKLKKGSQKYFIFRFAKLTAHHDKGRAGISNDIANKLVKMMVPFGRVYITSERELEKEFEPYRIDIKPSEMLDAINGASLYVGDSQTMAAEAAVLGTPSIRFNDFVGKLGYLEELEHKYGLTYGIKTSEPEKLYKKIDELLSIPNIKEEWQRRREKMLSEKIDVTAFMVWIIENYPDSIRTMKENPDYKFNFN